MTIGVRGGQQQEGIALFSGVGVGVREEAIGGI